MSKIIVVGSINMDLVCNVEEFVKPGQTISALDYNKYPSGKGANQAVALARNNDDVTFIGAIGDDDNGHYLKHLLQENNIDTSAIVIKDNDPTGTAFICVNKHHENNIIIVHGANYALNKQDILNAQEHFKSCDAIITQLEINDEVLLETAKLANKYQKPLFLNPAPSRKISEEVLKYTFCITPNQSELQSLTNMPCSTLDQIMLAARALQQKYNTHVIVTIGSKGALFVDQTNQRIINSYKVEALDTTAAGDSFCGALVSNYLQTNSFIEAIKYANGFAALSVTKKGAIPSIPTKQEALDFINNQK